MASNNNRNSVAEQRLAARRARQANKRAKAKRQITPLSYGVSIAITSGNIPLTNCIELAIAIEDEQELQIENRNPVVAENVAISFVDMVYALDSSTSEFVVDGHAAIDTILDAARAYYKGKPDKKHEIQAIEMAYDNLSTSLS